MKVGDDMKFVLNKNTPIPLYYQLKQWIIEQIERGDLKPGDVIPSERELSEEFEISRMTVRQALTELVNEGKLVRERGKGTFVAEPKISQDLFRLTSFSEDMKSRGMTPGASVIDVTVNTASSVLQKHLNVDAEDKVLIIKRLRMADDKPMALETAHFPLSKFPGLDEQDFNNMSIYQYIESHYNTAISSASQSIEVGLANETEAKLLDISPNSPILLIERMTYDGHRQPIEYVTSVYRGDRYKLYVELKR
jgi:GntR family transcriptional regulator